ncbi:MAG: TetR/AcrR family transcriptional regulator [Actinomycetota bacterium]|nr:TetR/AcrR family transcriptional regulator [Actinomycetota bacterium]
MGTNSDQQPEDGVETLDEDVAEEPEASGSRERLLDAGLELVLEHFRGDTDLRDVYDYLTPRAVAQRAGLSRGLIYHYWGDPDGDGSAAVERFLGDVSARLWSRSASTDRLTEAADFIPDRMSDVILALTAFEMNRITGTDRALMQASQAMTLNGHWPEHDAEDVVTRLTALYSMLGEKVGREPVPPLSWEDIAVAMSAVLEGFGLIHNVHPARTTREFEWTSRTDEPSDPGATWGLFSIVVEGVVANMTRPVGGGTDRSDDQAGASR